jgi:segregation and condensation protein A
LQRWICNESKSEPNSLQSDTRLLFPESPAAAEAAERDAATELRRIDDLAGLRAATSWLGTRPVLGLDVFARGAPEQLGVHLGTEHEVDVVAFLWASLSLFDEDVAEVETETRYRPIWEDLHTVAEARDRILRILGEGGDGEALGHFLPERLTAANGDPSECRLHLSSAWTSTFSASLELAKQGEVALTQEDAFREILLRQIDAAAMATSAATTTGR